MKSKMKMIVGIALVLGILSVAFLAAPIQAYVNETNNDDLLQTQDRDKLRTREQDCDGNMLRNQARDRLRAQDCDCTCSSTQTRYNGRQRNNQFAENRICNCTMNMEQLRHRYREKQEA